MAPSQGKKRGAPTSTNNQPTTWYAVQSEQHGREYYYNPDTKESTWILPDDAHPHPSQAVYNTTDNDDNTDMGAASSLEEEIEDNNDDYMAREAHIAYLPRWIQGRTFSKGRRRFLVARSSLLILLSLVLAVMLAPISICKVPRERVLTFFGGQGGVSSPFSEESIRHSKLQCFLLATLDEWMGCDLRI